MITVLYRKRSGEVLKISPKGQMFEELNGELFGYLIDPDLPDGIENRERLDKKMGPAGVKGFQKIAIPEDNIVRNATKKEINSFDSSKQEDDKMLDLNGAIELFESHPRFRKVFKAISKSIEAIEDRLDVIELQVPDADIPLMIGKREKDKTHKKIKDLINKDD